MATAPPVGRLELEGLLSALFSGSKGRWGLGVALEALAVLAGATFVLVPVEIPWAGIAVTVTGLAGSLFRWRGDVRRGHAEQLLRAKELRDGLQWSVDSKMFADLREAYSSLGPIAGARQAEQRDFYDTDEPKGARRLLEMIRESTWWSERLARFAFRLSVGLIAVLILLCLYAGLPLVQALSGVLPDSVQLVGLYTALICLLFSCDLGRMALGYTHFASSARDANLQLNALASHPSPSEASVLSIVLEYQVARAEAPPIPDWAWRLRRETLNEIWADEMKTRPSS